MPVTSNNIFARELDYNETKSNQKQRQDKIDYTHSINSFIWTASLLTSRGRLPENTDLIRKIGVKDGLDLSQLEDIPNATEIAILLGSKLTGLLEISEILNIPQRYVFAFYNAAYSLDLIAFSIDKNKNTDTNESKTKRSLGSFLRSKFIK